ncbi:MAG: hypothetical protein WC306_00550 [Candidatus Paceibacterota bacterium]|jgi:hypothetical protein
MSIIDKGDCCIFTNGGSCQAEKIQGTEFHEKCVFVGMEWECKDKSTKEKIKFLQEKIMNLGFFKMEKCKRRIEKKWKNHHENEEKIKKIRQKVKIAINNINSEIKLLKMRKE